MTNRETALVDPRGHYPEVSRDYSTRGIRRTHVVCVRSGTFDCSRVGRLCVLHALKFIQLVYSVRIDKVKMVRGTSRGDDIG